MGLYQTQEELDNAPKPIGTKPRLGDIRYMDINGDGQINSQDQVKIARNSRPELMFALMAMPIIKDSTYLFNYRELPFATKCCNKTGII